MLFMNTSYWRAVEREMQTVPNFKPRWSGFQVNGVTLNRFRDYKNTAATSGDIVGKYVASELLKGEYVLPSKISDTPANENNYLYGLTGEKRAISITIPSFAAGLSGKLRYGDIVSVIACDYRDSGENREDNQVLA